MKNRRAFGPANVAVVALLVLGAACKDEEPPAAVGSTPPTEASGGRSGAPSAAPTSPPAKPSRTPFRLPEAPASAALPGSPPVLVPAPAKAEGDCLANVEGISLRPTADGTGAPSFALFGCQLVHVDADGALRDRDLVTGQILELSPASAVPARPDRSPEIVVWDADTSEGRRIHAHLASGETVVIPTSYAQAIEPKVWGTTVLFTAFVGGPTEDTDILAWDAVTGLVTVVGGGPAQQRFPAISAGYIAFSDFREGGDTGYYDPNWTHVADIVVVNRATGLATTRKIPGKQVFAMLGEGDLLGFLEWDGVRPEPKDGASHILVVGEPLTTAHDRVVRFVQSGTPTSELRPTLRDGTFAWLERAPDGQRLVYTAPSTGTTSPPTAVAHKLPTHVYAGMPLAVGTAVMAAIAPDAASTPTLTRVP